MNSLLNNLNKYICIFCLVFPILSFSQIDIFEVSRSGSLEDITRLYKVDKNIINTVNNDGYSPLTLACYSGNEDVVLFLVDKVKTVNGSSKYGTPLMAAVVKGETGIVRLLLKQNADVAIADAQGITALHYATMFKQKEIVTLLIYAGADPNLKDGNGKSAIDHAITIKDEQIINILKSY